MSTLLPSRASVSPSHSDSWVIRSFKLCMCCPVTTMVELVMLPSIGRFLKYAISSPHAGFPLNSLERVTITWGS